MSWHLDRHAKLLLEQVIRISPDHGPARAMLASMKQTEANRLARREAKVDESLRQTSGDVEEDRARALDSAVLRDAGRKMGISGLPVIFDLPPAMAVQKTEQFKRYVHPVLQACCVRCHNPAYEGAFQLVPVKKGRKPSPDALRANLDATLRLIDQDEPIKSELLSSTLRPHGIGRKRHPIFTGWNDPYYQVLAAWVTSLRPRGFDEPAPVRRGTGYDGEVFAAGRMRRGARAADPVTRDVRPDPRRPGNPGFPVPPAQGPRGKTYRYVEGQGMVTEESPEADPREFPLPYMLGGPPPVPPGRSASKGTAP